MAAMKLLLLALVLSVACVAARPKWHQLKGYTFEQYVQDFRRVYAKGSAEYKKRESIFNEKLAKMIAHNADSKQTYRRGVNMFTDMTAAEWKSYNRAQKAPKDFAGATEVFVGKPDLQMPLEVDYRTWTSPRVLTAIKHQGSCGNCWAQSATESMEAYYSLLTGMLPVLSTQQITSCTMSMNGCGGGFYAAGWMYVNTTRGLTEEWAYPFTDFFANVNTEPTSNCKNITTEYPSTPYTWFAEINEVGISGYGSVIPNNATATMAALATIGPMSISVAAGNWQDYEMGVFQNTDANGSANEWEIDHAVQMVGYGHDRELNMDYWIVRNSWSTLWGEDGFIKLARPAVEPCSSPSWGPVCGTSGCLNQPQWPIVTKNAPRKF